MTCLFRRSLEVNRPRSMGNGPGGGCTGARGRGEMCVRGTTGGGGFDPVGWPSASRNLRMRSSSDSTGACSIGSAADGLVPDLRSRSSCLFFASPALLASNLNSAATAISRMKRRFSMCIFEWLQVRRVTWLQELHRYIVKTFSLCNPCNICNKTHVPSLCGLSPPAIDSRMEVSA
jgi:hypothetical protein